MRLALLACLLLLSCAYGEILYIPSGKASGCFAAIYAALPNGTLAPGEKLKIPVVVKFLGNQSCADKVFVLSVCLWMKYSFPAAIYMMTVTNNPLPGYNVPNCGYIYIIHPGVPTVLNATVTVQVPYRHQIVTLPSGSFINWNPTGKVYVVFTLSNGFNLNGTAYSINGQPLGKYVIYSRYYTVKYVDPFLASIFGNYVLLAILLLLGAYLLHKKRYALGTALIVFSILLILFPILYNIVPAAAVPYTTQVVGAIQDLNSLDNFICSGVTCSPGIGSSLLSYYWYYNKPTSPFSSVQEPLLEVTGSNGWTTVTQGNQTFVFWVIYRRVQKDSYGGFFGIGSWYVGVRRIEDKVVALRIPIGTNIYPVQCRVYEVASPIYLYSELRNVHSEKELEELLQQYIISQFSVKPVLRFNGWYLYNIYNEFDTANVNPACLAKLAGTYVLSPSCVYYTIIGCTYTYVTYKPLSTPEQWWNKQIDKQAYKQIVQLQKKVYEENTGRNKAYSYLLFAAIASIVAGFVAARIKRQKTK